MSFNFSHNLLISLLVLGIPVAESQAEFVDPRDYCDHALYPLKFSLSELAGSQWSYQGTDNKIISFDRGVTSLAPMGQTSAVALITSDLQLARYSEPLIFPAALECTAEGIEPLIPEQFNIPLPNGGLALNLAMQSQEGVFLPPFEDMYVGMSWSTQYEFEASVLKEGTQVATAQLSMTVVSSVSGEADVDVPAGTFLSTWVIDQEYFVRVKFLGSRSLLKRSTPEFTKRYYITKYLAEGVGLVRQEKPVNQVEGFAVDLVDYYIPM